MKRLLYILYIVIAAFYFPASAQYHPVKNVNDDYVIANLKGSEKFKNEIIEVLRDNNGLYWFRNFTSVSSFDGVNWKSYTFKTANGKSVPIRINEIEVTENGTFWIGTADGMFVHDQASQNFVPAKKMFPQLTGMPSTVNCIYKGQNNFLFISILKEGFYILDWRSAGVKYVIIDSTYKTEVPIDGLELDVTVDRAGNYWGLTKDNKGIWHYNTSAGKISCSWKGELPGFPAKNYLGKYISGITYAERDNSLWMSYGNDGILEKVNLSTGKRIFYTFSGDLTVSADTNTKNRLRIMSVKIDGNNNEWTFVDGKYLVRLNDEISKFEYLTNNSHINIIDKY